MPMFLQRADISIKKESHTARLQSRVKEEVFGMSKCHWEAVCSVCPGAELVHTHLQ